MRKHTDLQMRKRMASAAFCLALLAGSKVRPEVRMHVSVDACDCIVAMF